MATRITRADTLTNFKKQYEYFSDFLNSFDKSPLGNELVRVINADDVTQSIKNLINTNFGERFFQPNIGCNINASLFELSGIVLSNMLRDTISAAIAAYEPRAVLESVIVQDLDNPIDYSLPASVDKNAISVTIVYYLQNNTIPITFTMLLQRSR